MVDQQLTVSQPRSLVAKRATSWGVWTGGSPEFPSSPSSCVILHCIPQMQSYPEMLNRLVLTNLFYFKSSWVEIRAAAPMFIGKAVPAPCYSAPLWGPGGGVRSPLHPMGCTDPHGVLGGMFSPRCTLWAAWTLPDRDKVHPVVIKAVQSWAVLCRAGSTVLVHSSGFMELQRCWWGHHSNPIRSMAL